MRSISKAEHVVGFLSKREKNPIGMLELGKIYQMYIFSLFFFENAKSW